MQDLAILLRVLLEILSVDQGVVGSLVHLAHADRSHPVYHPADRSHRVCHSAFALVRSRRVVREMETFRGGPLDPADRRNHPVGSSLYEVSGTTCEKE